MSLLLAPSSASRRIFPMLNRSLYNRGGGGGGGAPCISAQKPLDYHGFNTVTFGDGCPIPSVHNILDPLRAVKMFAKLDLASS